MSLGRPFLFAVLPLAALACGLSSNGLLAPLVKRGADASVDATARDAEADAGLLQSDAASDDDAADAAENPNDDANAPVDAADGASSVDAGGDAGCVTGVVCNGVCTTQADCSTCTGQPLYCSASNQCLATCDSCGSGGSSPLTIECYACDANQENPVGTCQADDSSSYCLSGDYSGAYTGGAPATHCPCSAPLIGPATACPGATQVCLTGPGFGGSQSCYTCGEVATGRGTDGETCVNGGTCNAEQATCE